jgi:hypothetical protein
MRSRIAFCQQEWKLFVGRRWSKKMRLTDLKTVVRKNLWVRVLVAHVWVARDPQVLRACLY